MDVDVDVPLPGNMQRGTGARKRKHQSPAPATDQPGDEEDIDWDAARQAAAMERLSPEKRAKIMDAASKGRALLERGVPIRVHKAALLDLLGCLAGGLAGEAGEAAGEAGEAAGAAARQERAS
jgi:hypothetical protein